MDIIGIDFTSAPKRKKPITTVSCALDSGVLKVNKFTDLIDFASFEDLLEKPGAWIAGFDFPFGQSRKLVTNIGWSMTWEGYVKNVAEMTKDQYIDALNNYKKDRAVGDKEHKRVTDDLAGSISPQKLFGVPVGKMFFEGAPRLLRSNVSILPVRPNNDNRIALEAYPALVARRWAVKQGYKSDTRSKQTEAHLVARRAITEGIMSTEFKAVYGFEIDCTDENIQHIIDDATGDQMDSLLCAIQAAWAWTQRNNGFGIPEDVDTLEGWITEPGLVKR